MSNKQIIDESELDAEIENDLKDVIDLPSLKDDPNANHYVDNKRLHTELATYIYALREAKANGTPEPRVPEYVGRAILLISQRMATRPNFYNYSYKDEMIGDAVVNCLLYLHNYNPDKYTNPFGYLSRYVWNTFVRRINSEKKNQAINAKKLAAYGIEEESFAFDDQDSDGDFHNTYVEHMQHHSDFLNDYESKLSAKREQRKRQRRARNLENFIEEESSENDYEGNGDYDQ